MLPNVQCGRQEFKATAQFCGRMATMLEGTLNSDFTRCSLIIEKRKIKHYALHLSIEQKRSVVVLTNDFSRSNSLVIKLWWWKRRAARGASHGITEDLIKPFRSWRMKTVSSPRVDDDLWIIRNES
jgi:hypothetical protein